MVDDSQAQSQSLFVVLLFKGKDTHLSILQLDTPNLDCITESVLRFNQPRIQWSLSPPTSSTGKDLYLLPEWCAVKPLHGYKFNFMTSGFQNICLPPSIKEGKPEPDTHWLGELGKPVCAVNLGGCIYRLDLEESVFDCYDTQNNSWTALKPFPYDGSDDIGYQPIVRATAAWDNTILFNMDFCGLRAYDVSRNKWYRVRVHAGHSLCYNIIGEAVVLENTIYAITDLVYDAVIALSIEKEGSGSDVVFKCSLLSQTPMPLMRSIVAMDDENRPLSVPFEVPWVRTKHMVHLGGLDFCLVRSCDPLLREHPIRIHVTYMRLDMCKARHENQPEVVLCCFSLPKLQTTALAQGKQFVFQLDPFTAEDHASIRVTDLPPNVTVTRFEKGRKKYPINRGAIRDYINRKGGSLGIVPSLPVLEVPQSLFAVVFYPEDPHLSILQLDTLEHSVPQGVGGLKEHVVRFNEAKGRWSVFPISSTGDLYLFPDCPAVKPMHGYKFNLSTRSFQNFCLPYSIKEGTPAPCTQWLCYPPLESAPMQWLGKPVCAVYLEGCIYRLDLAESVFDCYDPQKNSWKALKPFPYDSRNKPSGYQPIVKATAAWDNTILFNMDFCGLRAYDVSRNEWYRVRAGHSLCYNTIGEAVVLEQTIYAITELHSDVLVALSLRRQESGGRIVFKLSLLSKINMPSMKRIVYIDDENRPRSYPFENAEVTTKHLVHLGGVTFCLVRSVDPLLSEYPKRIHVTYMRLEGEKVAVIGDRMFKTRHEKQSEVVVCFSLPKLLTNAFEEGKQFVFDLPPNVTITRPRPEGRKEQKDQSCGILVTPPSYTNKY